MGKPHKTTDPAYVLEWSQRDWDGPNHNPHADEDEPQWGPVEVRVFKLDRKSGESVGTPLITIEIRNRTKIDPILSTLKKEGANSFSFNEREALGLLLSAMCKEQLIKSENGQEFKSSFNEMDALKFWQQSKNATLAAIPRKTPERKGLTFTTIPPGLFVYEDSYAWIEYYELLEMEHGEELEAFEREQNSGRKTTKIKPSIRADQIAGPNQITNIDFSNASVGGVDVKLSSKFSKIAAFLLKKEVVCPPGMHEDKILAALDLDTKGSGEKKRIATLERPKLNGKNLSNPALNTVILKGDSACYYLNPAAIFRRKK